MLLTIKQLQVKYGKQTALQINSPISFEKGERIGVIGANGAGKTTLVKAILGLTAYEGRIVTELKPEQMAAHMQNNAYVTTMPVKRIMEMILDTKIKENKELQELIAFFEFEGCLSKRYNALSGGQKQKFTIIMIMMQKAELTFYDEVTSGLDFETRQKLMEKMVEWYRDKEESLIIVSHYYEELEQLADKILLLDQGKVVAFGRTEELFKTYCGNALVLCIEKRNPVDFVYRQRNDTADYTRIISYFSLLRRSRVVSDMCHIFLLIVSITQFFLFCNYNLKFVSKQA